MRRMKGQWEQEIDWQRTWWGQGKAQQQRVSWGRKVTGQHGQTQAAAAGANPVSLCLNEWNTAEVRSTCTSVGASPVSPIK